MNLARPKSVILIIDFSSLDPYRRFSGYKILISKGYYFKVSVDDAHTVAVSDCINQRFNGV